VCVSSWSGGEGGRQKRETSAKRRHTPRHNLTTHKRGAPPAEGTGKQNSLSEPRERGAPATVAAATRARERARGREAADAGSDPRKRTRTNRTLERTSRNTKENRAHRWGWKDR
jgi:hypothetical protein